MRQDWVGGIVGLTGIVAIVAVSTWFNMALQQRFIDDLREYKYVPAHFQQ
mgnify:CR=1 FL=1